MDDDHNVYVNCSPKFPLFSTLAVELRLKIWAYAFLSREPQIVAVSTLKHDCSNHEGWCPRYLSSPPPALVNVCHESRQIAYEGAVKTDQLHFISPLNPGIDSSKPAGIIFNPQSDILYVPSTNSPWSLFTERSPSGILAEVRSSPTLQSLRFLALNMNSNGSKMRLHDSGNLSRSLEEITFVAKRLGTNERLAFASAIAFLEGMRQRRRTRAGSYGDSPDRGLYPKICRFGVRGERGIKIMDHLGRFDVPWAMVANIMKSGD